MSEEFKNDFSEEQLDAPLVVHKKSDASYQDGGLAVDMNETHTKAEKPTLERHRFKKDPNQKSNKGSIIIAIIVILAAAFCLLYFSGNYNKNDNNKETKPTTTEATTSLEQAYAGTIVVKETYIFVDAIEVDGIEGLQEALRYEEPSTTKYKIIDEGANSQFLNDEVLPILMSMKFYDKNTEIVHQGHTGLMAEEELTTTTTTPSTTTTTTVVATTKA